MKLFNKKPSILVEAENAKFKANPFVQFLIFLLIFFIAQIISAIPIMIYFISKIFSNNSLDLSSSNEIYDFTMSLSTEPSIVLILLFCTIFTILATIVYCRFIEKRSLYSMGFVKKDGVSEYLKGLAFGLLLFSVAVLISTITGAIKFNGINSGFSIGIIILFFFGFLIQGMSEEVAFRGYFMISLSNRMPIIFAIIINSILFSLFHGLNPGFSLLAFINISLYGIFASIYTIKRDSLLGICAFHSIWNFVQGNLYGLEVSGTETSNSILSFTSNNSMSLINGGSFGLEGGIAVSIVLIIGIIFLFFSKNKVSEII